MYVFPHCEWMLMYTGPKAHTHTPYSSTDDSPALKEYM